MQPVGSDVALALTSWEAASICVNPTVCGPGQRASVEVCGLAGSCRFLVVLSNFHSSGSHGPVSYLFLLLRRGKL